MFLGLDFITVTKAEDLDWQHLKPEILGAIMEHFQSGAPAIEGAGANRVTWRMTGRIVRSVGQIKGIAGYSRAGPAVAQDGGDITFFTGLNVAWSILHMKRRMRGLPIFDP